MEIEVQLTVVETPGKKVRVQHLFTGEGQPEVSLVDGIFHITLGDVSEKAQELLTECLDEFEGAWTPEHQPEVEA